MKTAKQLLQDSIVIDTHLDLLPDVVKKHALGKSNVIVNEYMDSFKAGGVDVIVSSIFVDAEYLPELGLRKALDQVTAFYRELDTCGGAFVLATNTREILKAKSEGKLAIMLAFEGIDPLNGDVALLRLFYELGVRILGLCWSRSNWAADGSRFFDFAYEGYGLTEGGRALVKYAQELNMLIDISHTNEKTFWDVVGLCNKPIIATHSNTRALADTPRNLSDEQIKAVAKLGGVIGVNGASLLANFKNPAGANPGDLADHMAYEKKLLGTCDHLSVGLDICEQLIDAKSPTMTGALSVVFDIIKKHAHLDKLVEALQSRGFTDGEIEAALGKNVMRVFEAVLG